MATRILLVDDHALFRHGLCSLLEGEEGLEVVAQAENGEDALARLEDAQPDLLVVDLTMPGPISGAEVVGQALQRYPSLLVLVVTMHDSAAYLREVLQLGAHGYLLKNSSSSELKHAVLTVSEGRVYVDSRMSKHMLPSFVGQQVPDRSRGTDGAAALTKREKEVVSLLALGHTNAEVAEKLQVSKRTVEAHRRNILSKINVQTRAELVQYAMANALVGIS